MDHRAAEERAECFVTWLHGIFVRAAESALRRELHG